MSSNDSAFRRGAASDQDEVVNSTGTGGIGQDTRTYTEQAKDALSSGQSKIADTMNQNTNTTSSTTGGGFVEDLKNKISGGANIGGNQLFDKADNSHQEGAAMGGFLHKYTDETAPTENTA